MTPGEEAFDWRKQINSNAIRNEFNHEKIRIRIVSSNSFERKYFSISFIRTTFDRSHRIILTKLLCVFVDGLRLLFVSSAGKMFISSKTKTRNGNNFFLLMFLLISEMKFALSVNSLSHSETILKMKKKQEP